MEKIGLVKLHSAQRHSTLLSSHEIPARSLNVRIVRSDSQFALAKRLIRNPGYAIDSGK